MHSYHDANGKFPKTSYYGNEIPGWQNWYRFSANVQILPYIEQQSVYELFQDPASKGWGYYYNTAMLTPVKTFLCPASPPPPARSSVSWGGPGCNYGWSTGSSIWANWANANFNGMFRNDIQRKMADIAKDGLSNTLMASEMLPGTGTTSTSAGTYPYDVFYTADSYFNAVVNKHFPTEAELTTIGQQAETSPSGVRGNNGGLWAWYPAAHSTLTTAAPPNWRYPSAGGNCCPGGAHDWGWGIIPARSAHSGGVNAALGDGSVRFIRDNIDLLTWQRIGNARDGQVVGNF